MPEQFIATPIPVTKADIHQATSAAVFPMQQRLDRIEKKLDALLAALEKKNATAKN